jgi:uncharacterized protein YprB with RNaseH-like and TPR domain
VSQPWTPAEVEAAVTAESYAQFAQKYPHRNYNSWEVKRRRARMEAEAPEVPRQVVPAAGVDYVGPKIAFWDLETTFSTQPRILTGAIADGFGQVTSFTLDTHPGEDWLDDSQLAVAIRDALEGYDIIVGWNSKLFDVPVLNGRLRYHALRPLQAQMHVDLMYYAGGQFMRIGSKSLKSVSEFFDSPNRKTPLSPALWDRADHGDREAYETIIEHNIADVLVTRDVWPHLQPMIRTIHRAG